MNHTRRVYQELIDKIKEEKEVIGLETDLEGNLEKRIISEHEETSKYVEWFGNPLRAVICGGGHVSLYVAQILHMMNYKITVIDDREEFVTRERFPIADELICGFFEEVLCEHDWGTRAYYIIVTRGHAADYTCLKSIVKRDAAYIGMIGSKGKVAKHLEMLEKEEGTAKEVIGTIHAPIGLKLGGKTAAEISVEIAAEILEIKCQKQKDVETIDFSVLNALEAGGEGVLITVLDETGSSPGKRGHRAYLDQNGKLHGSIGGGNLEYQAGIRAAELMKTKESELISYDLSDSETAKLGMICGGNVRVLFEYLSDMA